MIHRADRFTVVVDTDVLVGALSRNVVLSLAEEGFFRPRWSATTLAEFETAFVRLYGDAETARRQRRNIEDAFPEAVVCDGEALIDGLALPDPNDRHVLAAAIKTRASVIVTNNLKDFPKEALAIHQIEPMKVDDFVMDCIDLKGVEAVAALRKMRERFNNPHLDAEGLILRLEKVGMSQTATLLVEFKALL
ncbi:PIN domain-containing protein [Amaricoccus sp.]|uniref:PIN domain-containing protein n=1 Tax=Amaricoccus sp. TaxID=1872485 RepID=UPI002632E184|nr:PIN domain-containing protein [Amaricoccus sp.]HRO11131.1 PIN domain-containing protein [Amaricoccus sp.]